jgi:hypothetical protein
MHHHMSDNSYQYQLDKSSKKYTCPRCQKKRFVRYIDTSVNELLPSEFGRCDREQNCQYWLRPEHTHSTQPDTTSIHAQKLPEQPSYIDEAHVVNSFTDYETNRLAIWMKKQFGLLAVEATQLYGLGTSTHWPGASVFWQKDASGNVRTGKVMLFDDTGHRVKEPRTMIYQIHKKLYPIGFALRQCFFGEHLLTTRPEAPVAIVESEKTAMVASIYFPEFVWIATGGSYGCKWTDPAVSSVLKGRNVTLFPDLGAYSLWAEKAKDLDTGATMISSLLEKLASPDDYKKGLDIADYLEKFNVEHFHKTKNSVHYE